MVVHGHDTTLPVTVDDMLLHCKAVSRGSQRAFRIADLPFGSYETSPKQAVETAIKFMKDGNMDAIKLEGSFFALVLRYPTAVSAYRTSIISLAVSSIKISNFPSKLLLIFLLLASFIQFLPLQCSEHFICCWILGGVQRIRRFESANVLLTKIEGYSDDRKSPCCLLLDQINSKPGTRLLE